MGRGRRRLNAAQDFWPAMFYFYSYFHFLHFFAYTKLFRPSPPFHIGGDIRLAQFLTRKKLSILSRGINFLKETYVGLIFSWKDKSIKGFQEIIEHCCCCCCCQFFSLQHITSFPKYTSQCMAPLQAPVL